MALSINRLEDAFDAAAIGCLNNQRGWMCVELIQLGIEFNLDPKYLYKVFNQAESLITRECNAGVYNSCQLMRKLSEICPQNSPKCKELQLLVHSKQKQEQRDLMDLQMRGEERAIQAENDYNRILLETLRNVSKSAGTLTVPKKPKETICETSKQKYGLNPAIETICRTQ